MRATCPVCHPLCPPALPRTVLNLHCTPPHRCLPLQVEARLRQLEGKQVGGEAAKPRGLPGAEKYDAGRATGGCLLSWTVLQ